MEGKRWGVLIKKCEVGDESLIEWKRVEGEDIVLVVVFCKFGWDVMLGM